jgi:hypothetical protein
MGLMLTCIGLFLSYLAYRRRGLASGLRGVAWSLLPLAAALTRTLKLAGEIVSDVGDWATHLVFSPTVWLGISLAGVSVVLFGTSAWLRSRGAGAGADTSTSTGTRTPAGDLPQGPSRKPARGAGDDDFADIEAILRKHGIQ